MERLVLIVMLCMTAGATALALQGTEKVKVSEYSVRSGSYGSGSSYYRGGGGGGGFGGGK